MASLAILKPVLLAALVAAIIGISWPSHASYHKTQDTGSFSAGTYGVFGIDSRQPVPTRYEALKRSIGRLSSTNGQSISCTAFCVAPDVIATASHCLFSKGAAGRRPSLASFEIEFESEDQRLQTKIAGADEDAAQWNVVAGTTAYPARSPLQNAHDWALLKLSSKACDKRSVKLAPITDRRDVIEAVYHRRIFTIGFMRREGALRLTFSGGCDTAPKITQMKKAWAIIDTLYAEADDIVTHKCDIGFGASGSPLFFDSDRGPVVIALNNGTIPVPARILFGKSPEERRRLTSAIPTASNVAVSASAFMSQIALMQSPPTRLLASEIRQLQLFLKSLGYYKREANGQFDVYLRQAIVDFEKEQKLLVTGRPSLALLQAFK